MASNTNVHIIAIK